VDVIAHKDPSLSVNVTQEGADGRQQYTANYTTDGKEAVNQIGPREVKSTLKWAGSNLLMTSKLVYNDVDVTGELTWSLSGDGKIRTVSIHYSSAIGETDQKLIFEKQESGAAAPAKTP
jgi:hypothetical protein